MLCLHIYCTYRNIDFSIINIEPLFLSNLGFLEIYRFIDIESRGKIIDLSEFIIRKSDHS
jgi:hypothetical protein